MGFNSGFKGLKELANLFPSNADIFYNNLIVLIKELEINFVAHKGFSSFQVCKRNYYSLFWKF